MALKDRFETGTIQFEDDWVGIAIRGDNSLYYAEALNNFLDPNIKSSPFDLLVVNDLLSLLFSVDHNLKPDVLNKLKAFKECKQEGTDD